MLCPWQRSLYLFHGLHPPQNWMFVCELEPFSVWFHRIMGCSTLDMTMIKVIIWMLKCALSLYRNLRQRDATKYHIQLCIALFCMLTVFVSGIDQTGVYAGCVLVSVLIHYFTLVFVMWMGAEALLMFQKLVVVFVHITTRYIVAMSFVCWRKCLL